MAFGMRHTAGNGNISINELEQVLIEVKFFPVYIPCNDVSAADVALWQRER